MGTDSQLLLKDVGPSQVGAHEFNQLFNRNTFEVTTEAVAGSRDSLGGQVVMNGLMNRIAYSATALNYETDGFVVNDSAKKAVYDLFVHGQVLQGSTMQLDVKRSEIDVGQTFFMHLNRYSRSPTLSRSAATRSVRAATT